MDPGSQEHITPAKRVKLDKRVTEILPGYNKEIAVDADNVGASFWPDLIRLTQTATEDGLKEHGMVVSMKGNKFIANKIKAGGTRHTPSPTKLHGILPELLRGKGIVAIHTHPMEKEDQHLSTTVPSDADIQAFDNSNYAAFVILDQRGAHLLIQTRHFRGSSPPANLVEGIYQDIKRRDGTTRDVQRILASKLEDYGLSYYCTTSLSPNPNGTVTFRKPH